MVVSLTSIVDSYINNKQLTNSVSDLETEINNIFNSVPVGKTISCLLVDIRRLSQSYSDEVLEIVEFKLNQNGFDANLISTDYPNYRSLYIKLEINVPCKFIEPGPQIPYLDFLNSHEVRYAV